MRFWYLSHSSTLYAQMDSSFWFDTINLGPSIAYIEGSNVINLRFSLKIFFDLAKSVDPAEMPHNVTFYLGLHCL